MCCGMFSQSSDPLDSLWDPLGYSPPEIPFLSMAAGGFSLEAPHIAVDTKPGRYCIGGGRWEGCWWVERRHWFGIPDLPSELCANLWAHPTQQHLFSILPISAKTVTSPSPKTGKIQRFPLKSFIERHHAVWLRWSGGKCEHSYS